MALSITLTLTHPPSSAQRAIFAACMQDDLKLFTAGIKTEIGERGINIRWAVTL